MSSSLPKPVCETQQNVNNTTVRAADSQSYPNMTGILEFISVLVSWLTMITCKEGSLLYRGQCEDVYSVHCPPGQRLFLRPEGGEAYCDCDIDGGWYRRAERECYQDLAPARDLCGENKILQISVLSSLTQTFTCIENPCGEDLSWLPHSSDWDNGRGPCYLVNENPENRTNCELRPMKEMVEEDYDYDYDNYVMEICCQNRTTCLKPRAQETSSVKVIRTLNSTIPIQRKCPRGMIKIRGKCVRIHGK